MTVVHGSDDVVTSEEESFVDALFWARDHERSRGHFFGSLRADFEKGSEAEGYKQYGTDYHYVTIERVSP